MAVNNFCRKFGKKFISTDVYGVFGRIFNDFGDNFEVLDKNGEELPDCMIKNISVEENGLVELLPNNKHKLEDNDEVTFTAIEGMQLLANQAKSINQTICKVKVVSPYSFHIGDTRIYTAYKGNGLVKQLRTKLNLKFKSFEQAILSDVALDANLSVADFEKMSHHELSHLAFAALDVYL